MTAAAGHPERSEGSAVSLSDAVRRGARSPLDVVDEALRAADALGGPDQLNAIVARDDQDARRQAAEAATRLGDDDPGALLGVPVLVKDNIATTTLTTTCASRVLAGYQSPFESTATARLRRAGAVILGKTNMDEFAMGSSTEFSCYGPTRNPIDRTLVPGGSSGGSAAAVAAGITRIALGSETGGSVRQPAAFCGIVGVKPTYGRVSRYGLVAFASSLDHIGVFGGNVSDAALGLQVIAGHDPRDATSADVPTANYYQADNLSIENLVIGKPREYFPESLDPRVRDLLERALESYRALGATVRDVSLPHTDLAIPAYYIIAPAEASSNLARFDGVRYGLRLAGDGVRGMYEATRSQGFGPEVTRRILLGTYVLSAGYYDAYYRKAMQVRTLVADDFRKAFASGIDVIFTPTTPTPAFPIGAKSDPYEMYLSDIFTVTANLAGVPAMSLPVGRVGGLPVGAQLIAPHFEEQRMFAAAFALERSLGDEAHR